MAQIEANGITIEYEQYGSGEPLLLIMGLGGQLTDWPEGFPQDLAAEGFQVTIFDNRDIGLSTEFDWEPPSQFRAVLGTLAKRPPQAGYLLSDMAGDAAGLLDALGIDDAHVVGISMGGMIAQLVGINHPERLLSLTSVMSTTGNPSLPMAEKHAMEALVARPNSLDEEDLVAHGLNIARNIGSPGYPLDPERVRERTISSVRRSVYPPGLPRQLAAIIDDGCRRSRLASVTAPTLVLHGEDDPLVKLAGGEDTANHISGAKLVTFPGWGHDLPLDLVEPLANEVAKHARAVSEKAPEPA